MANLFPFITTMISVLFFYYFVSITTYFILIALIVFNLTIPLDFKNQL